MTRKLFAGKMIFMFGLMVFILGQGQAAGMENSHKSGPAIRLAVVITPAYSGLIRTLIDAFSRRTQMDVDVYSGSDVFRKAKSGNADLVISHYGKQGLEEFVLNGYGDWPRPVFSNQAVIIGPKDDPAGIRRVTNGATALKLIVSVNAPFVFNAGPSTTYLFDILWQAAGRPEKGAWFIDKGVSKGRAIRLAEKKHAYTIWGAYPFIKYRENNPTDLDILVSRDPLLQRIMVCVRVNADKISGINARGAAAFQDYLLHPGTQAQIAAFRSHGVDQQLWWPAGRHN